MGWLDNLLRRRQGRTTAAEADRAQARAAEREARIPGGEADKADVLEEEAHRARDEEIFREPRKPPGTG
jgi:hypothetical protein